MPPSLETEPTPSFWAHLGTKWKVAGAAAAMSLTAVAFAAGGGGESENVAMEAAESSTTAEGFDSTTTPSIEDSTTTAAIAAVPETQLETTTTSTTVRAATTLPPAPQPPATGAPVSMPPTTAAQAPTTTAPPTTTTTLPQKQPLQGPSGLEMVGDRASSCYDDTGHRAYGRICLIQLKLVQNEARSIDSGQKITSRLHNCAPGETPRQANNMWICDSTWAQSVVSPENVVGEVTTYGAARAAERTCFFAYSQLEQYDSSNGNWYPQYVSDTASNQVCVTVDNDGNIID